MRGKLLACRLLALVAAAGSGAALVDSLRDDSPFCALGSGCQIVSNSAYARPLGIPLPVVGLFAFSVLYLLTLIRSKRGRQLLDGCCLSGGFAGLALLLVQFVVLRQVCRVCLVIDLSALLLALVVLAWPASDETTLAAGAAWWRPTGWAGLLALTVAAPVVWGLYLAPHPPLPAEVLALQKPDRLVVVIVTDFTCAHCRETHPVLREVLREWDGPTELIFRVHCRSASPSSEESARTFLCATEQGRGQEVAEALFDASEHTPEACERIAVSAGVDLERFRRCRTALLAEERLDCNRWVESTGAAGLPVIWVGKRRLVGRQSRESLRAALSRANSER